MSPTSQAVEGVRAPSDALLAPAPEAARTTSSSSSSSLCRGAVRLEQLDRVPDDLVEDVLGIELARELAARLREPLRERPGPALELVQLAALERAPGRTGDVPGQLELLVGEDALAHEEDERQARLGPARLRQRHREQRAEADGIGGRGKPVGEAAVLRERP